MPRLPPAEKLAKLEAQAEKLNQEIQRTRTLAQKKRRKDDTRRKVLVGAMILETMEATESDQWPKERLIDALDSFLIRDRDRALFGLPPKPTSQQPANPARPGMLLKRAKERVFTGAGSDRHRAPAA
jgi:uncharacterized membrane protein YccC